MDKNTQAAAGQYLTFIINKQTFGVAIASVREINRYSEITPVPQTPAFMAGVINLRDKVIPVVDLRLKFGYELSVMTKETCIIVFEGNGMVTGAIVDAVRGVINLDANQIEANPRIGEKDGPKYVLGMGKIDQTLVVLVDPLISLADDNLNAFVPEQMPALLAS